MIHEELPLLLKLPEDSNDPKFTKSFDYQSLSNILEFFNEYGFVVIHSIYDQQDCLATRNAMFSILESMNPGYSHNDRSTWHNLKSKGNYGLSMRSSCYHPILVNNRQNEKLAYVLNYLITTDENELIHFDVKNTTSNYDNTNYDNTTITITNNNNNTAATNNNHKSVCSNNLIHNDTLLEQQYYNNTTSEELNITTNITINSNTSTILTNSASSLWIDNCDVIVSHDRFAVYRPTHSYNPLIQQNYDIYNNCNNINNNDNNIININSSSHHIDSKNNNNSSTDFDASSTNAINSNTMNSGSSMNNNINESIYGTCIVNPSDFSTGIPNIHLDMNPWWWLEDSDAISNGI